MSNDFAFQPEEYGFIKARVIDPNIKFSKGNSWVKGKFILICLSDTLFVLKKKVKNQNNTTSLVVKWHMVIDNPDIAKYLLTSGLRG